MARVPKARLIPSYERYVLGVNSTVPAGLLEPEPDFPAINRGATVVVSLPGQGIPAYSVKTKRALLRSIENSEEPPRRDHSL